jgi:transposase
MVKKKGPFMSKGYQTLEVDIRAIEKGMKEAENASDFKRYQTFYLRLKEGLPIEKIAKVTGLAKSTIRNLHSRCRQEGIKVIKTRKRGGKHNGYLRLEEERKLLKSLEKEAYKGGRLNVKTVHAAFEKKVGGKVALFTTYKLLQRHGWRKIVPRPRHPQADQEAQEAFKKTGKISSEKQKIKPRN